MTQKYLCSSQYKSCTNSPNATKGVQCFLNHIHRTTLYERKDHSVPHVLAAASFTAMLDDFLPVVLTVIHVENSGGG